MGRVKFVDSHCMNLLLTSAQTVHACTQQRTVVWNCIKFNKLTVKSEQVTTRRALKFYNPSLTSQHSYTLPLQAYIFVTYTGDITAKCSELQNDLISGKNPLKRAIQGLQQPTEQIGSPKVGRQQQKITLTRFPTDFSMTSGQFAGISRFSSRGYPD